MKIVLMMLISVYRSVGYLHNYNEFQSISGYTDVHGCWGDCYLQYTEQWYIQ